MKQNITIQSEDPRTPDIHKFIDDLDAYQAELYPPESNHLEPVENLITPDYYFIAARTENKLLGIASFRRMPAHKGSQPYVEIKRLYVPQKFRGKGLATQLMDALEEKALAEGYSQACLETGISQNEALRLYKKRGYQKTLPFGTYREDPLSVFMRKKLS
jgi:putative acetyltransferase